MPQTFSRALREFEALAGAAKMATAVSTEIGSLIPTAKCPASVNNCATPQVGIRKMRRNVIAMCTWQ